MLVHDVNVLQTRGMLGAKSSQIGAIFASPYTAMYRFLQKYRWIPSLHLMGAAFWIIFGSVLIGLVHGAQAQPMGVSIVTDYAGDDLHHLLGVNECLEEIQIETEVGESEEENSGLKLTWAATMDSWSVYKSTFLPQSRTHRIRPRPAQFSQPKTLFLAYCVLRI
jgi:hypothetical protein